MVINRIAISRFEDRAEPGAAQRSLNYDECTLVHLAVEMLSQRQPDGTAQSFAVGDVLRYHFFRDLPRPERYVGPVVEYLQRLVAIGLLVEDTAGPILMYQGTQGRRYRAPAWLETAGKVHISPARALGVGYVAHTMSSIVVRVHSLSPDGEQGIGSGVVIANELCVTNAHVVEGRRDICVSFGGGPAVHATEVRRAKSNNLDLAVVEAPGLSAQPNVWIRDPMPAEAVVAMGYPYVPGVLSRPLLRFPGHVSSDEYVNTRYGDSQAIVTAVFTPGASGGAVFSSDGYLVGLVVRSLVGEYEDSSEGSVYPIFHAMIPGGDLLRELPRMHKKCWFLNEFAGDNDLKQMELSGRQEEYELLYRAPPGGS